MRRLRLVSLMAGLGVMLSLGLAACASEPVELSTETVIIDVRTPDEYTSGHLEGAVNVDLQSGTFETSILEFPLDGNYAVYCQSGNRSGQAVSIMMAAGFENVQDLGGVQAASTATGIPIVTD
jgi:phage shock protein E